MNMPRRCQRRGIVDSHEIAVRSCVYNVYVFKKLGILIEIAGVGMLFR